MNAALLLVFAQVPLPGTTSVSVALSPPLACSRCHSGFEGSSHDTWTGSVMGHAARDPVFLAALTVAEHDAPGVGDLCLRCHAPEAWLQGRCLPADGSAIEPQDSGVTCSFCHRNQPNPYVRNGQYIVADDSVMRGPYADAQAPHTNRQSGWISESALCGTCHDLYNPLVARKNLDGTPAGAFFPEQTTYTEWRTSAWADPTNPQRKDCMDCHLPEDPQPAIVAQNGPDRPDRSSHAIAGANVWLLEAIEFLFPDLGIGDQLAVGRAAIRDMLRKAATLELRAPPTSVRRGQPFTLTIRITNETGHKLPTGYPEGRKVYLAVRSATLGIDRTALDPVSGEPVDPLAVYHTVHGQYGIGPGHHLALNDVVYFDNRIPPRGLVVTATTAPIGETYPEVSPGVLAHWDDVTFTATVPCGLDVTVVEGELLLRHQVLTKSYVDVLVAESASVSPTLGAERSARLRAAWDAIPAQPEPMAELRFAIPVDPSSTCDPPDAGVIDTGLADALTRTDATPLGPDAGPANGGDAGGDGPDAGCGCNVSTRPTTDVVGIWIVVLFATWAGRRQRPERVPRNAGGK